MLITLFVHVGGAISPPTRGSTPGEIGMLHAGVTQIVTFSSYASFRTRNYPMLSFGPPVQVRG